MSKLKKCSTYHTGAGRRFRPLARHSNAQLGPTQRSLVRARRLALATALRRMGSRLLRASCVEFVSDMKVDTMRSTRIISGAFKSWDEHAHGAPNQHRVRDHDRARDRDARRANAHEHVGESATPRAPNQQ